MISLIYFDWILVRLIIVFLYRYPDDKGCYVDSGYNTTNSTTKNNLLINLPEKKDPHKNNIPITKNKVILKCKKIYLWDQDIFISIYWHMSMIIYMSLHSENDKICML